MSYSTFLRKSNLVVSCLLILGSLTIPILAISVFGQGWTTSTGNQTVTSTMLTNSAVLSDSNVLLATPSGYTCEFDNYPFTGGQNQSYSLTVTSNNNISVYILTASNYQAMKTADECAASVSSVAARFGSSSFELDFTTPAYSKYYIILSNGSHGNSVQYNFNLNAITSVLATNAMNFTTTQSATNGGEVAVTSYQTFTTTFATTKFNYQSITTSVTTSYSNSLYSGPFTITPTGQDYCGIYDNFPFTAQKNDVVVGTIASNITVSFYVMSEAQYQSWLTANRCGVYNANLFSGAITSYNVNYVVPSDGSYEFLFLSEAKTYTAGITFDASLNSGASTIAAVTSYSMIEQTLMVTSTGSSSSILLQQPLQNQIASNWLYIALAILGAALLALFVSLRKGSKRKTGTATSVTKQGESKPEPQVDLKKSTMYCRKCGAKIPRDSVFCKECGATQ